MDKDKLQKLLEAARERRTQVKGLKEVTKLIDKLPNKPGTIDFAALRAKIAANNASVVQKKVIDLPAKPSGVPANVQPENINITTSKNYSPSDKYGNIIEYNDKQQSFIDLATGGKNCILIGSAGTGKTTCMQGAIKGLIDTNKIPQLDNDNHKHLPFGTPGIVIVAYTRRAVNNIKRVLPADLRDNCITVHKLLEYQPHFYEIEDEEGNVRKTMEFIPTRNSANPLPSSIHTIIVEESSMLSTSYHSLMLAALPHKVQWIFLGDINQLPPIFGPAILGYKMLEWDIVELTQVYRQALESPIIRLAHRILSGKTIPVEEYTDWHTPGKLTIHPWKKKLSNDNAVDTLGAFFKAAYDSESYDPDNDMILIPYNKSCGTIELNNHIANHIARTHNRTTYEVIAGYNKHYFSIGDKVLYEKEDAEITDIEVNHAYTGARVQKESKHLDYWGHNQNVTDDSGVKSSLADIDDMDMDKLLEMVESSEDRVLQSSHRIIVNLLDSGTTATVDSAADVNNLLLSYALTVHKSQGSEWNKVFLCLHQSHATMLQRELLYTAVTRAKEELYVICEPESFTKGILSQRIKGNTLAEKAEFFKGKIEKAEKLLDPIK